MSDEDPDVSNASDLRVPDMEALLLEELPSSHLLGRSGQDLLGSKMLHLWTPFSPGPIVYCFYDYKKSYMVYCCCLVPLTDQLCGYRLQWLSENSWDCKEQKLRLRCQLDPSMTPNQLFQPSKPLLTGDSDLLWKNGDGGKCLTSTQTIYVESLEVLHKMKSSLVKYQETEKNVSTWGQDLKCVDLIFHIWRGSTCQYLTQRRYYGNKCPEIKVITYLEVNWGQDIRLSYENCFTLLSITVGYETAESTVMLPFPNW